jgi:DNA-binding winged helix-turn-helix (wHTH) protein/TolB-like protein/Tfp pilus assembly protein PilF
MSKDGGRLYDFGPFRLDAENHTLAREGRPVTLTRKALEMLIVLVEHGGDVLAKEELLRRLWPDTTVEESNLTQNVYMIRQALGEAAGQQTYIETIPKRGYRFVAGVTAVARNGHHAPPADTAAAPADTAPDSPVPATNELMPHARADDSTLPPASAETTHDPAATPAPAPITPAATDATAPAAAPSASPFVAPSPIPSDTSSAAPAAANVPPRGWRSSATLAVALAFALAAVAVAAVLYFRARGEARQPPPPRSGGMRVIAVLPFRPLGPEAGAAHLGLGMTDAMITKLSNLQHVSVRPTSAIIKYVDKEFDPLQAGRELGVEAVLEGSVQRAGENVRVSVRLLSVADGRALWGESFGRKMTDVFAVQDAISSEVAEALRLKLTSAERSQLAKHYTQSPEAYQAYARGLYFWSQRTEEGFRQSIRHFEEAIAKDPAYALAYAGLADTYGLVAYYGYERVAARADALARARAMAERAVSLDDTVAEGHAALGLVKSLERDWQGASGGYRRALALNPNYATARQRHALLLLSSGRLEEATAEMRRAQEIDPLSVVIGINLAQMSYYGRDYARAAAQCETTIETAPPGVNRLLLTYYLGNARVQQGRLEEARALFRRALEQDGEFDEAREGLAYTAALAGRREEALSYSPRFRELTKKFPQAHLSLAVVHAALGERDQAFAALDAYAKGQPSPPVPLRFDPRLDPLRSDPRFQEIFTRNFSE